MKNSDNPKAVFSGVAELFVTQINEQRHVLEETGKHLQTLSDIKSRQLAARIEQVLADHIELYNFVEKLTSERD